MRTIHLERSRTEQVAPGGVEAGGGIGGGGRLVHLPSACRALSCNALKQRPLPSASASFASCFYFSSARVTPQRPSALTSSACRAPCLSSADTRYTVEDIEGALLKQMKASKDTGIAVKKPEEQNIRFTNYGNSARRLSGGESCQGLAE